MVGSEAIVDNIELRLLRKGHRREIWHEPDGTMDVPCDAEDYGAEACYINPDGPEAADTIKALREALTDIQEACQRRQLPLTDQIWRRAETALASIGQGKE
jgi:hypothetical protein